MFQTPPAALPPQLYISKPKKMAAVIGMGFLLAFWIIGLIAMMSFIGTLMDGKTDAVGGIAIGLGVMLVTGFAIYKLFPVSRRLVDYTPRFPPVPGYVLGQPFDVRLVRKSMGASFRGEGVVQFFGDHVIVDGQREMPSYMQIVIALLLMVAIAVLTGFQFIPGIIPLALIVPLIGRKKLIHPSPYHALRAVTVKGVLVTFKSEVSPHTISFYVSSYDYERLMNEIQQRFPALLAQGVRVA